MSDKMTEEEFGYKVSMEGGLYEALFSYGLDSDDVEEGPLKEALKRVEAIAPSFVEAMDDVEALIEEYEA